MCNRSLGECRWYLKVLKLIGFAVRSNSPFADSSRGLSEDLDYFSVVFFLS